MFERGHFWVDKIRKPPSMFAEPIMIVWMQTTVQVTMKIVTGGSSKEPGVVVRPAIEQVRVI